MGDTSEHDLKPTCERCQGNGEIVTDWDRYLNSHEGDIGDEAVAECPDCNGSGKDAQSRSSDEITAELKRRAEVGP